MAELTTLARLKRHLGIAEDDTTNDAELNTNIDEAEEMLRRICNRPDGWLATERTETFDGEFSGTLVATYVPIDTAEDFTLSIDDGEIDSDSYVYNERTGVLRLKRALTAATWDAGYPIGFIPTLGTGVGNVTLTYTGGYGADEIPAGLQRVATELAAALFGGTGGAGDPSVTQERLGDHSISYDKTGQGDDFLAVWTKRASLYIRDAR